MTERPLLPPREVPVGARVFVVPSGESEPAADKGGKLPALRRLTSSHGNRRVFVPEIPALALERDGSGDIALLQVEKYDAEEWGSGVRFTPVDIFLPQDAPMDTALAVIVDDHCLTYADFESHDVDYYINVSRDSDGTFRFCERGKDRFYGRKCTLPEGCVLTPVGEVGAAKPLRRRHEEQLQIAA